LPAGRGPALRHSLRFAARLFELGALIVAGYNEAVDEMAEELEAFDQLLPPPPEENDIPF
jgi:hypothetical protein